MYMSVDPATHGLAQTLHYIQDEMLMQAVFVWGIAWKKLNKKDE
jgi:hypothetical protein